jgi:hypothetical protein
MGCTGCAGAALPAARGIGCPKSFSIARNCMWSSAVMKLVALPLAFTRAVRPIRWM